MGLGMEALLAAAAALGAGPQAGGEISTGHDLDTRYNRTDYEAPCGAAVFRVRFRNGPDRHGEVDHVKINGRSVPRAAEQLRVRAAQRTIERIEIMNCGMDPRRPVFRGLMKLSPIVSRRLRMPPLVFFRLSHEKGAGWQLKID